MLDSNEVVVIASVLGQAVGDLGVMLEKKDYGRLVAAMEVARGSGDGGQQWHRTRTGGGLILPPVSLLIRGFPLAFSFSLPALRPPPLIFLFRFFFFPLFLSRLDEVHLSNCSPFLPEFL